MTQGVGVTDRKRSGQAPQSGGNRQATEAAGTDQGPLWIIALPTFACTVVLASYLILIMASRLI
jgi:hypothetical protein